MLSVSDRQFSSGFPRTGICTGPIFCETTLTWQTLSRSAGSRSSRTRSTTGPTSAMSTAPPSAALRCCRSLPPRTAALPNCNLHPCFSSLTLATCRLVPGTNRHAFACHSASVLWRLFACCHASLATRQFYASGKSADPSVAAGDVVQLAATWEAFKLHESIMGISVEVRAGVTCSIGL